MLKSNSIYLDYNATSPLALPVINWLSEGDFSFANPASVHKSGKKAKRALSDARESLYSLFKISSRDYQIIFHSGATEGINSLVLQWGLERSIEGKTGDFFAFSTDHSCVRKQVKRLEELKQNTFLLEPLNDDFELEKLREKLQKSRDGFLNWTWSNNETGEVYPLEWIKELNVENFFIHVDAVQVPGKVESWNKLIPEVDAYTFSGHKFGSLKGIGFTIIKQSSLMSPLLLGGGQQKDLRSGTENPMGVQSVCLALRFLAENYDHAKQKEAKDFVELEIQKILSDRGEIVRADAPYRNGNTICFLLKKYRADVVMTAFDLEGFEVSSGSACGAGTVQPNPALIGLGYSEDYSKNSIRLSFSPYFKLEDAKLFTSSFLPILKRFLD